MYVLYYMDEVIIKTNSMNVILNSIQNLNLDKKQDITSYMFKVYISKTGETVSLIDFILYCKNNNIIIDKGYRVL